MPRNSAGITQRGISLIEAAAVLPVFLFLIVLVVEFGLMSLVHAGMNEAGDAIARHEMSIMSKEASGARSEEAFRADALGLIDEGVSSVYRHYCERNLNDGDGFAPLVERRELRLQDGDLVEGGTGELRAIEIQITCDYRMMLGLGALSSIAGFESPPLVPPSALRATFPLVGG